MHGRLKRETFDAILTAIEAGEPAVKSIEAQGVNRRKFYAMLDADANLANRYARAMGAGQDAMADKALEIADDLSIEPEHKRIMVDARKWWLAKRAPKKYGERTVLAGDPDAPLEHRHIAGLVERKLFQGASASDSTPELVDADGGRASESALPVGVLGKT